MRPPRSAPHSHHSHHSLHMGIKDLKIQKHLPSSLGDDHLRANLVELDPEVLVLQAHLDVLVEASSRMLGRPV